MAVKLAVPLIEQAHFFRNEIGVIMLLGLKRMFELVLDAPQQRSTRSYHGLTETARSHHDTWSTRYRLERIRIRVKLRLDGNDSGLKICHPQVLAKPVQWIANN